ncbi:vacuolar membrane hydrolase, implicted in protein catabolism or lipid metabolism [Schizosaccharomyces osmophilus]|uniref:Vacuolar membrane hydrolase, implicted in protein catabolism or lipid metabolism n=1 Tax=Schizosaccharomyces osmophilus TaxID=2545709 RepID=A0AAF0AXP1_9SCHI|nr:vacuolar membrane hydrolase, implicted in protein catabolism or lipid metabolism [Schizosaccharomyces osmophilus]WBW74238.1 vacuolar membrane hydrolase, implicted in protein catabolism or lipid metabolism [Schizosaccharomyces osmophilus]
MDATPNNPAPRSAEDMNERSALLPRFLGSHQGAIPQYSNSYALTPLFYWIRSTSLSLLIFTLFVHLLLLINLFISIPILSHLSTGFTPIGFTALSALLLAMQLTFVYSPNAPERITQRINALLLVVDVLIVVFSPILRHREGWRGIFFVLWAFLMSLWIVFSDEILLRQYKEEHPEYTTGSYEHSTWSPTTWPWRRFGNLTISMIFSIILTILTIHTVLTLALRAYDGNLTAPGKLYTVTDSKAKIHLECFGSTTSPNRSTVLIEGGEVSVHPFKEWILNLHHTADKPRKNNWNPSLVNDQVDLSFIPPDTRVCVWDRPGMGWSDNIGSPSSIGMVEDLLSEALAQADVHGPYVLVGHGIGGSYSNIFAARHIGEVKGMLLIDSGSVQSLQRSGGFSNRFLLFVRGWLSPLGINRLFGTVFLGRNRKDRVYGSYSWTSDRWVKAKLEESITGPTFSKSELRSAQAVLPKKLPVSIITSGNSLKNVKRWSEEQRELSKLTDNTIWEIVNDAPHEVWKTAEGAKVILKRLAELYSGR